MTRNPSHSSPLRQLMSAHRVTSYQMALGIRAPMESVNGWRYGLAIPTAEEKARVRAYLEQRGVPCGDDLFDATVSPAPPRTVSASPRRKGASIPPLTPEEIAAMQVSTAEMLSLETMTRFKLTDDPFDGPDRPDDIWMGPSLTWAETSLERVLRRFGIAAVVAPPGGGKSTLLRRLHGRMERNNKIRLIAPATLDRRAVTPAALAVAILRDLTGQETSGWGHERRSHALRQTLQDQNQNSITPTLFIDETHLLPNTALISIKQIWDSHTDFKQLAVLMVGQPPLKARLHSDTGLRELAGRTSLLELPPLGKATADYLRWRFSRVGADADVVFDAGAYKALELAEYPLWINNAAMRAMNYATRSGERQVTAAHVGRG